MGHSPEITSPILSVRGQVIGPPKSPLRFSVSFANRVLQDFAGEF
jgi:hypothetical protein